ncbi:MAG: hypothetical protein CMN18_00260 [Roseovarius sp.]|nr:hypothetical protein [Roseovarius sp.]
MRPSIRIEASTVDPELTEGLAARVADPLWYLARQWQVGEFKGEDAASPVAVDVAIDIYPITQVRRDNAKEPSTTAFTPGTGPIEPMVEAEPVTLCLTPWDHMQASLRLLQRLAAIGLDLTENLQKEYELPPGWLRSDADDRLGQIRLRLLARRAFDPRELLAYVLDEDYDPGKLPFLRAVPRGKRADSEAAVWNWARTEAVFAATAPEDAPTTWRSRRQEYVFALGIGSSEEPEAQIVLAAPEHTGGRLDWDRFDLARQPKEIGASKTVEVRGLVSPLRFPGQPAARFWELEEGEVYFGDLQGGAADLNRAILGAYAAVAGDDWFVMPVRLPRGHVARVARVRVRDNFDPGWHGIESTVVNDAKEGRRVWRAFEHRAPEGDNDAESTSPLLLIPPIIVSAERSAPVEEVHFRRDEIANLAWAIERRSLRPSGRVIEASYPVPQSGKDPEYEGDWSYVLGTDVPDHWFPLVPVRLTDQNEEITLRRGQIRDAVDQDPPRAKGVLLTPDRPFYIDEAEVPHGGARVTRGWRFARGADGSRHLWMGRRKEPSTGPMALSPLSFDTLRGWPPRPKGKSG